ncbi:hypothetical protein [Thalassobacillus sp. C254]|uniref:hypothetical protein n=1 Tax=Thalassobacillus sp. C254 TaxID=1225341 RepID=UPI0006CFE683|nr:hypothetical protein [Thalassobacillus sp. C254]
MQKTKLYMPLSLAAAGLIFTLSPASGEASEQETEVTIIHTNDIHSSIEDFGKLAAFLEEKRSESDHVVFLDGGDIFSGDPIVDIPQGAPMVDLLNNVGLDAWLLEIMSLIMDKKPLL